MSAQHEQNLLSSVQTVLVALIENTAISLLCSARKQSAFFFFHKEKKFLIEILLMLYKTENPQKKQHAANGIYSEFE